MPCNGDCNQGRECICDCKKKTNMVTVPLDKLKDMQRRLKQPTKEEITYGQSFEKDGKSIPLNEVYYPPKQEPVGFRHKTSGTFCTSGFELKALHQWIPLYTHPKQWQGLSDEEIAKLTLYSSEYTNNDGLETISLDEKHFVKAIEQALKEKNG